jgi:cytoskeletal protein RodZ
MTDQFSFLGDKYKAAIAAMSLGVLLLLPSSLGFGGTMTMQEAFGQFNLPLLEDETVTEEEEDGEIVVEEEEEEETTTTTTTPTTPAAPTTTVQDPSAYLMADRNVDPVRGFIGSTLPTQGAGTLTASDSSGHVATGRFRVFANDSAVESFVTEMNVAAIDGSSFHNITIREGDPHRFEVTAGNGTAASSNIVGNIFLDGGTTPVIDNVPMTLSISGQVLAIQGIDIDEARITDTGQRGIISVIDGQTIYGTIPRT